MGVTDGVVRAVAFSKGSVVLCPLHPSPPSRASPVPACNGSGLSRARSNHTHNTRSKSLCRALRFVTCASSAYFGSQAYHRRSVQFKARVRRFAKPVPRTESHRKCSECKVSSSSSSPVRVKALHAHRRSHTAIRGPSRAAAHTNFTADARLRVFRVRNFAASAVTHAPVRPSGASTIALVRVQHGLQATRKANLVIEFVDGRPQSYVLGCRNASGQPSIDPLVPALTIVLVASRPNLH